MRNTYHVFGTGKKIFVSDRYNSVKDARKYAVDRMKHDSRVIVYRYGYMIGMIHKAGRGAIYHSFKSGRLYGVAADGSLYRIRL